MLTAVTVIAWKLLTIDSPLMADGYVIIAERNTKMLQVSAFINVNNANPTAVIKKNARPMLRKLTLMTDYHGNSVQTRKQRSSSSIKLKMRLMRLTVPIWKKSIWIKLLILSFLPSVDLKHSTKYHKELTNAIRYPQKDQNSLETNKKVKLFSWLISLRSLSYFKVTWFKHQMIMKVGTQRTGTLLTQLEMSSTLFKMNLKKGD